MAKITRKHQKIFAGDASVTNNGQFGSAQLGTKITSNDPDTIQNLAAWGTGWLDATLTAQRLPTLEEMQGIQYVTTYQIAYLFQEGIPEWNASAEYYDKSFVKFSGTSEIYVSKTDSNVGNLPSDPVNWDFGVDVLKAVYTDETSVTDGSVAVFETDDSNGRKIREEPIADLVNTIGNLLYPVGSYYINETDSTNPATLLGFGTWTAVTDRFIVGRGGTFTGTGGSATDSITLTAANLPPHQHEVAGSLSAGNPFGTGSTQLVGSFAASRTDATALTNSIGSATPFNVDTVPPYQAAYVWKRIA